MPPGDEERRRETDELQVSLGVNIELVKDLRRRVDSLAGSQQEEIAELHSMVKTIVRDDKLHDEHHEWIETQLEISKDKAAFWKSVSEKIATAGIWSAILLVCGVLWYAIKQFIKNGATT